MILRDPVHGLISFETAETEIIERLLAAKEVQRLRRIRQLGLTSLAFPGAEHTRFAHAVGAAFVMQRFLERMRSIHEELPFWQRVTSEHARDALAASLLHDLGHGPLSHMFEEALPGAARHEQWTRTILLDPSTDVNRILSTVDANLPTRVADLIDGIHDLPYLANAVSGTFDVDRCDYLLRDAHMTGARYGDYDLPWLLRSLRFGPSGDKAPPLAIDGLKGVVAIESFLLARLFMFQQVYFHKTTRSAEWMIGSVLRRALDLLRDGARLPLRLRALTQVAAHEVPALDAFLELDDPTLLTQMAAWEDAKDPVIADLCKRLSSRRLFKTLELPVELTKAVEPDDALQIAREIAKGAGLDPDHYVGLDVAGDVPFTEDGSLSIVFPDGRSLPLGECSFLLGRLKGAELSRCRLIFAAELRDEILSALA